ncbi:lysozyme inhibitor LprI family protein [Sulfitobacter sp. F26169L]|uniref:lysozyme inhibitor LprI family protein n=1 Tax=Sulfitobacter sp. F26169L TaxID=2996015 RepID=UPI002260B8C9|nr:lysozyme inhibitor LprI family protein [Sulfitobacter sp. F26169L]MCX7564978.1 lysozyme inhibitor LprI family protein [Sulfitobacter sp. F26169L]
MGRTNSDGSEGRLFCQALSRASTRINVMAALVVAGAAWSAPTAAQAQTAAQCIAPQTQQLMNACAAKEYAQADAALNAAWKPAKAFADAIGKGSALLEAQRAWIAYRDIACDAHASPFEGGSMQPLIRATCLSELTAARTRMLLEFHAY